MLELFQRAFVDGFKDPSKRPTMSEWVEGITKAEDNVVNCATKPNHFYGKHLHECPWCQYKQDAFPDAADFNARIQQNKKTRTSAEKGIPVNPAHVTQYFNDRERIAVQEANKQYGTFLLTYKNSDLPQMRKMYRKGWNRPEPLEFHALLQTITTHLRPLIPNAQMTNFKSEMLYALIEYDMNYHNAIQMPGYIRTSVVLQDLSRIGSTNGAPMLQGYKNPKERCNMIYMQKADGTYDRFLIDFAGQNGALTFASLTESDYRALSHGMQVNLGTVQNPLIYQLNQYQP